MKISLKKAALLIFLSIALGLSASLPFEREAHAHEDATGVVKERMELMKSIAKAMKKLAALMKGKADYDAGDIEEIAAEIKRHAKKIPTVFPKGSLRHPSEAKAKIWDEWENFVGQARQLERYASLLEEGANVPSAPSSEAGVSVPLVMPDLTGEAEPFETERLKSLPLKTIFSYLGKSCKACHQTFRQKKKK